MNHTPPTPTSNPTNPNVRLTRTAIDEAAVLASVKSPLAGACILFVGTTRGVTNGRKTSSLHYEAYETMARSELARLREEAMDNWPLIEVCIEHLLGEAPVTQTSVAVAVSSAHRKPAFEAAAWIMDELKAKVPIWKQERWDDGSSEWVHPGMQGAESGLQSPNVLEDRSP